MLIGTYNVAMVKMLQGVNTTKEYAFALYDEKVNVDDLVLCDTQYGYAVARVVNIMPLEEYEGVNITKEVICKVDFDDFEKRKDAKRRAKKLKSSMDKIVKELQDIALVELMAEKSPELKSMLDKYKELMH